MSDDPNCVVHVQSNENGTYNEDANCAVGIVVELVTETGYSNKEVDNVEDAADRR